MSGAVLGWDVGGANVKAARLDGRMSVRTRSFPLWQEPERLPAVLAEVAAELGGAERMGITMTAELADCFTSKAEGVGFVLDAFARTFPGAELRVYGTDGRFRSLGAARAAPSEVAAANWAATAALLARWGENALLIDTGSTTTDIIPIVRGRVVAAGRTDPERLRAGELVYTGALRTPICAILRAVRLGKGVTRVAAEHFAIAADAHLWLGRIRPAEYTCPTPDGRGIGRAEVAARLARVVCADPGMLEPGDLSRIARAVGRAQRRQIASGIDQVLARLSPEAPDTALVAGRGAFLARAAARRAGLSSLALARRLGARAAAAAPAAALAHLLAEGS